MISDNIINNNSKYVDLIANRILIFGLLFSFFIIISPESISVKTGMKIYGGLCIILLVKTFLSKKITTLGPAHILILYTLVSSFGYDMLVLFGGDFFFNTISSIRHAYLDYFNQANALFFVGTTVLVYGVTSVQKCNVYNSVELKEILSFGAFERDLYLKISLVIVSLYSLILLFAVVTGRIPLTSYADVRDWFSTQPLLAYLLRLTWVSIPTYFFFVESKQEYFKLFIPLGIMFFILMLSGNRNEVLYPAAVATGVFIWKRYHFQDRHKLPKTVIVGAVIIVFILNPLISSTRQSGLSISNLLTGNFGVSNALLELGQQINPFSIILYALDQEVTSFKYGMTFLVPTISILSLNLIWGTSVYNSSINYNPTLLLNSLGHYGRGFSFIAEFYYNFGIFGMVICMILIGRYMGKRENDTISKRKLLFYFQIMPLFMIISRNICGYNILIIVFACILNLYVQIMAQIMAQRNRR